jgi:hypothetical protein
MPRAIIILDDEPDGRVSMSATFENGYSKISHAHGQAALIIQSIDEHAAEKFDQFEEEVAKAE